GRLRRPHPGWLAGGPPGPARGTGARRPGHVRGLAHPGRSGRHAAGAARRGHAGARPGRPDAAAGLPTHRPTWPYHLRGGGAVRGKLDLDPALVRRARQLARRAGRPVVDLARGHTTVSVERAVLRLAGPSGADPEQTPWGNRLVDAVAADVDLAHGVALPVFDALLREGGGQSDPAAALLALAQKAVAGSVRFTLPTGRAAAAARRSARRAVAAGIRQIDRRRAQRE